jgi:hypothetical protein
MIKRISSGFGFLLALMWLVGCGESPSTPVAAPNGVKNEIEVASYLLAGEPADAKSVIEVRQQSKDGDTVIIVGKVGGSTEPIVKGRLAFTIIDLSFKDCKERDESCDTPWDYCHLTKAELAPASAMIKVADAQGKTIAQDLKDTLGIEPLRIVVVKGKAKRDSAGNLTVLATGIYVRPR